MLASGAGEVVAGIIYDPQPYVYLGSFGLSTHGLLFLFAALLCRQLLKQKLSGSESRALDNSIPYFVLASLVGARSFFVLSRPDLWGDPAEWLRFWDGGMVSYGGLLGFMSVLYLRHFRVGGYQLLDRMAPAFLICWGVGRIGCFLSWWGEPGSLTSVPWAVVVSGESRHPVTAYLALLFIFFGVALYQVAPVTPARVSGLALMIFGSFRALCDFCRDYDPDYLRTLSQLVAVAITLFGWILLSGSRRVLKADVEPAVREI